MTNVCNWIRLFKNFIKNEIMKDVEKDLNEDINPDHEHFCIQIAASSNVIVHFINCTLPIFKIHLIENY